MSETSLTSLQFVKNHMLLNVYHPHDMPIAKELIWCVKNSNVTYKEALKQKRESEKKAEKDQRLASIEEELTQLNLKKSSVKEAKKDCHEEADEYASDAEKKENLELLKLSNGLHRAAEKKQIELGAVLKERKYEEKKKHVKWSFRLYYVLFTMIFVVGYSMCLIDLLRNSKTALSCIQICESHSVNSFEIWITEKYLSMS